jgi:hypothetical protein
MTDTYVNHRIEYVPLTKDLNGNHLIYPIYIPINIDEPEIFAATGKLSSHDYKRTLKLLHSRPMFRVDEQGCGSVEEAGFPFAPLIAALAPIVIPGAIKAVKSIFNKSKSSKLAKGRLYMGRGDESTDEDTIQSNMDESESDDHYDSTEEIENELESESKPANAGYIPTNPNINSIKKLQSLYDTYK